MFFKREHWDNAETAYWSVRSLLTEIRWENPILAGFSCQEQQQPLFHAEPREGMTGWLEQGEGEGLGDLK